MFGIKFASFDNQTYVSRYSVFKSKKAKREGYGLSFVYFAPTSRIVAVPIRHREFQFMFTAMTRDCQTVNFLIQIIYHISKPEEAVKFFDFSLDKNLRCKEDNLTKVEKLLRGKVKAWISSQHVQNRR